MAFQTLGMGMEHREEVDPLNNKTSPPTGQVKRSPGGPTRLRLRHHFLDI